MGSEGLLRTNVLILPETLTLAEIIEQFKATREDFALIINEYALIVGLITLNDVTSTLMGNSMVASRPTNRSFSAMPIPGWSMA
jgi:CBS domain containing-hemolysin-like protein